MKQATYVREQNPNSRAYIFYIDLRTPGTYEFFSKKVQSDKNVSVMKGKVAKVIEDPTTKELIVEAEDVLSAQKFRVKVDLVVLATGMVASIEEKKPAAEVSYDKDRFILPDESAPGIYVAGCARGPVDVASAVKDATAAALKAIQAIHGAGER